jgi:glycosyltransferase involved in cell wall biosynthesis
MTSETTTIQEKPLITFALFAYNQERFIREAVEGALSQTYSPLEIILSDDCSSDGTFEIMHNLAAGYYGQQQNKIILNQNETNLGIGAHINRVMELANGELIVVAAGDDISLPHRTAEIYKSWINSDKKAFSLYSEFEMIDACGNVINGHIKNQFPQERPLLFFSKTLTSSVSGCTHAWHRKVFDFFGPLPNIICEDLAIPPRSMLLGRIVCIENSLVKYRIHENNIWASSKNNKFTVKESINKEVCYLRDKIKICDDVIRCINEYKYIFNDSFGVRYLDEYVANIVNSREKFFLKIKSITDYPLMKFYHLLKYHSLYGLQRRDLFWIVCAISINAARLSLYCKRIISNFSKTKSEI